MYCKAWDPNNTKNAEELVSIVKDLINFYGRGPSSERWTAFFQRCNVRTVVSSERVMFLVWDSEEEYLAFRMQLGP